VPGAKSDVSALIVIGTEPPAAIELVVAEALNQPPPVEVVEVIVNEVEAVPVLLKVELPVTTPDPAPFNSGTEDGFTVRLSPGAPCVTEMIGLFTAP
jgi:hypothetical protein